MKLLYATLFTVINASILKRDWSCPALITGCTKSYLVTSGTCDSVATANSITVDKFYQLNPSINRPSCNNMYSGCAYCVSDVKSVECPKDYDPRCDKFYTVKNGNICWAIIDQIPGLSLNQLYQYNPSIHNPSCDNLVPTCGYCVHVPQAAKVPDPHQPNIRTNCKEYYQAVPGDYCYKLANDKGVDLNSFLSWNPDVGPTCLNMLAGYYYCLRI
ncbi:hypothetical protein DPSP01_014564 [Paraphaeosphaeria sporulosa]